MPTFTEQVKLITDANETLAAIAKVNEAISKLRANAHEPIQIKVQSEFDKAAAGEKKVRDEKVKTNSVEEKAHQQRVADYKTIKAMNKEVGNPSFNVRYGSQQSLEHNQKFATQLGETTRRINQLADAHKHIARTAKEADVALSPKMAEKLAGQTIDRTEKDRKVEATGAIALARERQAQETDAAKRIYAAENVAEKERVASVVQRQAQETEGAKRVIAAENAAEKERIASVVQRQAQETEGAKRIIAEQKTADQERASLAKERQSQEKEAATRVIAMQATAEKERIEAINAHRAQKEEGAKRAYQIEQQQEREVEKARRNSQSLIAQSNQGGIRGMVGEVLRDSRRNMVYGGIARGEAMLSEGYHADVAQDTMMETLRQAGRTSTQINDMVMRAQKLSFANPTVTTTEMMQMEQHNVGAFGDYEKGMANNNLSARYLATRKGKVGEEKALSENLAILKIGEETGHIRDGGWMRKLYDQQLKIAQAEGAQYNPESLLTTVRMLKSTKYGLSDETLLNILPFAGMGEGAARIGNQISMLQKSMSFTGKSLSKQNEATIAGTILSDKKGGYNPELFRDVAAGDLGKLATIMDKFFQQKGFDPTDKSRANINNEMTELGKAVGNASAKEAMVLLTENRDQIEKQQRMAAGAQGLDTPNQSMRTLQGAMDATTAQFDNMSASILKTSNPLMIRTLNGLTYMEEWAAKNAHSNDTLTVGSSLGALALFAGIKGALNDPEKAAQTGLLSAISTATAATAYNTGAGGLLNKIPGIAGAGAGAVGAAEAGAASAVGLAGIGGAATMATLAAGAVAAVYDVFKGADVAKQWWELHKLENAAKSPEEMNKYNKGVIDADNADIKHWQEQAAAHKHNPGGFGVPEGEFDPVADNIAKSLQKALDKLKTDAASPFKFKDGKIAQDVADKYGVLSKNEVVDPNAINPFKSRSRPSDTPMPVWHETKPIWITGNRKHKGHWGEEDTVSPHDYNQTDSSGKPITAQGAFDKQYPNQPKIDDSPLKAMTAALLSSGASAAEALKGAGDSVRGGAGSAASSIADGGANVATALNGAAAAIRAAQFGGGIPSKTGGFAGPNIIGHR